MKKKILTSVALLAVVPYTALAQTVTFTPKTTYFTALITQVDAIIASLTPVVIAAAVVYFLWGVLQFVSAGDDAEKRKAAQGRMIHGVIAIFVMVSLWGLVGLLSNTLGLNGSVPPIDFKNVILEL